MRIDHPVLPEGEADVRPGVQLALGAFTGAVAGCVVVASLGGWSSVILGSWLAVLIAAGALTLLCLMMESWLGWRHYTAGASLGWHTVGLPIIVLYLLFRAVL